MKFSNRIWIYGPVALLLLLAAGYVAFWYYATGKVSDWLDAHNGREIMPGVTFEFADKDVGGFPFRADVVLSGVTFSHRTREGETAWRAEKLALHAMPYNFGHYIFEAAGLQSIARPPEKPGMPARILYVTPGLARASALLDGNRLTRADIDLSDVGIRDATLDVPANRTARIGRMQLHLRADPDRTVDIAFRIDNARIDAGYGPPLGPDLRLFLVTGKLTESQTLEGVRHGKNSFYNTAEAWRLARGVLEISDFQFQWGGVSATAKGRMRFDDQHRLRGRIESHVAGYPALVEAARRMGQINGVESTLANAALYALSQLTADAQGRLPVTFRFEDGRFKVGPITAAPLEPVY